jgi:predicted aspartyl protease
MTPPALISGLLVKARINGGPLLRLLLDSGAQQIVIDPNAARKSECDGGVRIGVLTPGAPAASARNVVARTVEVGDLAFHDVPLLVAEGKLAEGIEGVFPLSLFSEFVVRIDFRRQSLDLLSYEAQEPESAGALPAISSNRLLFVKGSVNGLPEGYFLVDTGASYTAISRGLARDFERAEKLAPRVALRSGTATIDAPILHRGLRFQIGSEELQQAEVVVMDFSSASRYHGVDISGLIGYPALRNSVLTVDYRNARVRIQPR